MILPHSIQEQDVTANKKRKEKENVLARTSSSKSNDQIQFTK
jgi:hypothetical protein